MESTIHTIGHGRHPFAYFLELLQQHEIEFVCDVRAFARSRWPQFNGLVLRELLNENGSIMLYNYYRKDWLLKKIELIAQEVSGNYPRLIFDEPSTSFKMLLLEKNSAANSAISSADLKVELTVDDWPFLYLKEL